MNDMLIRAFVRQVIAEAKAKKEKKTEPKKKEEKLPKSSGKLMDLKKEIAYLKEMSEQLQATGLNEAEQVTEVEFSNLQKFVNELNKVKQAGAALKAKLDEEITATEAKIKSEKDKIKEMIGLTAEAKPAEKDPYGEDPNLNVKADKDLESSGSSVSEAKKKPAISKKEKKEDSKKEKVVGKEKK